MYYRPMGRCSFPRFGTCNRPPRMPSPQENHTEAPTPHAEKESLTPAGCRQKSAKNLLKCSAFGGLVLPEGTEKGATYHVASLNLDNSGCKNFKVHLSFSCNIILRQTRALLRFRLLKQEKYLPYSVPVSAEVLYSGNAQGMEANTLTLSACDWDSHHSPCCTYSVYVDIADFQASGSGMIANPVLIAEMMEIN